MNDDDRLPPTDCLRIMIALVVVCWIIVGLIVWGAITIWPN